MEEAERKAVHRTEVGVVFADRAMLDIIQAMSRKGAAFRFQAGGFSMHPAIRDGDIITLAPLGSHRPGRGDVIAFTPQDRQKLIIHRVLKAKNSRYLVRGDHAVTSDGWIPGGNVLGRVSRVERGGKCVFSSDRRVRNRFTRIVAFLYLQWLPLRRGLAWIRRRVKSVFIGK